ACLRPPGNDRGTLPQASGCARFLPRSGERTGQSPSASGLPRRSCEPLLLAAAAVALGLFLGLLLRGLRRLLALGGALAGAGLGFPPAAREPASCSLCPSPLRHRRRRAPAPTAMRSRSWRSSGSPSVMGWVQPGQKVQALRLL